MRQIRWGMIGCGDVAEVKSGPAFYKSRHSTLVAVMRRNGALAEDFARRHGVPRWHTDADAIIHADDIDAVYIATRPDSHADYVLRCAAAGKPVYVEKPMALKFAECERMVQACEAAGVPLWVAFYRRSLERFVAVKRWLESGEIGVPIAVNVRHFLSAASSLTPNVSEALAWRRDVSQGGGQFIEAACHTLDLLDFYFGPLEGVGSFVANRVGAFASEDVVVASFRLGSGVVASGVWCFAAAVEDESVEIVGSAGSVKFSVTRATPIELTRLGVRELVVIDDPAHVQQPLIQSIVDELNQNGRCPSTARGALNTARALESIMQGFVA